MRKGYIFLVPVVCGGAAVGSRGNSNVYRFHHTRWDIGRGDNLVVEQLFMNLEEVSIKWCLFPFGEVGLKRRG